MNKWILLIIFFVMACNSKQEIITYYDTGEIKSRVHPADTTGGLSGEYIEYSKVGEVVMKGKLNNGKRVDKWTYYHPDGSIKAQGGYVDGLKKGIWNYDPSGDSYQVEWEVYIDSNLFKINVPSDWSTEQTSELHLVAREPVEDEDEFGSNFNVSSMNLEQISGDLKSIAKTTVSQTIEEYAGLSPSIVSHEKTIINNKKAEIYSINFEGNDILSFSYFIKGEGKIYYLNFFTKTPEKDALLLREIALSFNMI